MWNRITALRMHKELVHRHKCVLSTNPKGGTDGGAGGALATPLLLFEGIAPPLFLDPSSERVLTLGRAAPYKL